MNTTFVISEHGRLPDELADLLSEEDKTRVLNPHAGERDRRWFFEWGKFGNLPEGFYANYVIGAQWVGCAGEERALVVTADKISGQNGEVVDFLKMFEACVSAGLAAEDFAKIYGVDLAQKPIKTDAFTSVLSPLLVAHYLMALRPICAKGLKRDYVSREENLKKVKGKLLVLPNDRKNILQKRFDRFYCRYQEHVTDIPENRLLKKALVFCLRMLNACDGNASCREMVREVKRALACFVGVGDEIVLSQVRSLKANKLYREYVPALKLAKMILRRFDFNIANVATTREVPAFWIDMPLLYEMYVLGVLKKAYGEDVVYQFAAGGDRPDFLDLRHRLILDTKYKPEDAQPDTDIIRQLSGYARNRKVLAKVLGLNRAEDDLRQIVPCVFIYPTAQENGKNYESLIESLKVFQSEQLPSEEGLKGMAVDVVNGYVDFYKIYAPLPVRNL